MTGADVLKEFINCECGDQCDCEVDGRDAMADEIARLRAERDALRSRLAQYALGGGEPIPCAAMAVQP